MTTRSEIAAAFRAAKPFLSRTIGDGLYTAICIAMSRAVYHNRIHIKQLESAQEIIRDRISPHTYATYWLANALGEDVFDVHDPLDREACRLRYEAVQDWRHRWLDSLIEEFSKE